MSDNIGVELNAKSIRETDLCEACNASNNSPEET